MNANGSKNSAAHPDDSTPPQETSGKELGRLVLELIRPYRGWLAIVFVAMLVETIMSIAAPWPLKIIIDNVVGDHKLPEFLTWLRDFSAGEKTLALAGVIAFGSILIAVLGAVAGYIDNYYTESVAHYVANDLGHRLYSHGGQGQGVQLAARAEGRIHPDAAHVLPRAIGTVDPGWQLDAAGGCEGAVAR